MFLVRIVFGVLGRLWCGGMAQSGEMDEGLTLGLREVFRGRKGLSEAYKSFVNALVLHDGQLQVVGNDAGATTQVKDRDTLASVIPPACRSSFAQSLPKPSLCDKLSGVVRVLIATTGYIPASTMRCSSCPRLRVD